MTSAPTNSTAIVIFSTIVLHIAVTLSSVVFIVLLPGNSANHSQTASGLLREMTVDKRGYESNGRVLFRGFFVGDLGYTLNLNPARHDALTGLPIAHCSVSI